MRTTGSEKKDYSVVNGIRMYYEMHGEGEPVVLIHGGGSTIDSTFSKIIPLLSSSFRVIAPELQAHGRTGDRDAPESFEQDADDVAALLANIGIKKAHVFGFSNGGNTAMQLSVRYPDTVGRLIIASSFYKREGLAEGFFEGMKGATIHNMPGALKKAFLKVNPDESLLLNMFNKDKERMLGFTDWPDELLTGIKKPTLLINGDMDVVKLKHTLQMKEIIHDSRVLILPAMHGAYMGVAELPYNKELTRLTTGVIKGFLNSAL